MVTSGDSQALGTVAHLSGPTSWSFLTPETTRSTWNQLIMWASNVLKRNPENGSPHQHKPPNSPLTAAKFSYVLRLRQRQHSPLHLSYTIGPLMLGVSNAAPHYTFYQRNEYSIRAGSYNCKLLSHLFCNMPQLVLEPFFFFFFFLFSVSAKQGGP